MHLDLLDGHPRLHAPTGLGGKTLLRWIHLLLPSVCIFREKILNYPSNYNNYNDIYMIYNYNITMKTDLSFNRFVEFALRLAWMGWLQIDLLQALFIQYTMDIIHYHALLLYTDYVICNVYYTGVNIIMITHYTNIYSLNLSFSFLSRNNNPDVFDRLPEHGGWNHADHLWQSITW